MSNFRFQKSAIAAAVLSLGFSMGALAQGSAGSSASGTMSRDSAAPGSGAGASDKLSRADRKFVEEAAMGSMAEVRLGQLAQQKASSEEVKQFASRMVDDHSKALEQLSTVARADGVQVPSQLDKKHQRTYDRLQKLSGAEFDREYMKEMTSDHKKDVNEFEKAAKSAKDDQVQQFAQQTLPTLREHRKMAESTSDDLRKSSTVSMRSQSSSQTPSRSTTPQNR